MSQIDAEKIEGSEEPRNERLIDVSEAIRYRKRAQSAELKNQEIEQELVANKAEIEKLNKNVSDLTLERQLIERLVSAGVRDLEAAVIIGRSKLENEKKCTAAEVVEQLKKDKSYLFSDNGAVVCAGTKTSGVKDKLSGAASVLERSAKKASKSGSRTDLQDYLRARRKFV